MRAIIRYSKWRAPIYTGTATLVLMLALYYSWDMFGQEPPPKAEVWLSWTFGVLLVQVGISYRFGQTTQRKLDQLQLAMKHAAAGNLNARLPEVENDAFTEVHRDFNRLLGSLEARLKLLQQLGERDILEEATNLEAAVLEERRRLARDLHDSVSQQLFALHMSASSLPKLLELNPEQANKVMEQLIAMSSTAQRQMRGLIAQLRPMELQGRTLCEAMDRWFPDYCRQNGLQGTLDMQLRNRLPEAMEHQLFLIVQEAMGNVVKHAEATSVRLYLGETDSQVVMNIEDDGTGFRSDQVRTGAYGLSTMRERAQKLGGEAEIMSKPGAGTKVKVWFPIFGTDNEESADT